MSFSSLEKLIKKRLEQRGLQQGVTESKIQQVAKQIIKKRFSNFSDQVEVLEVKEDRIIMKAGNSSVAQEIQLHQEQIVEQVNQEVDQAQIEKIVFKSK